MKITNILCAIDFSELSDAAVEYAVPLAQGHSATLHLVHVYEPVLATEYMSGVPALPAPADLDQLREALEAIRPDSVECRHELILGYAGSSIVDYAVTNNVDLIIMGTHGRTGLSRLLMGSVAEAVTRAAKCPVLIVHDSDVLASQREQIEGDGQHDRLDEYQDLDDVVK